MRETFERDRRPSYDYREDHRDYSEYDDDQIRDEIDRLRSELTTLKRALEDRKAENTDIRMAIKASEQANLEVLGSITHTLDELTARIEQMDSSMSKSIKSVKEGIRDDMDELNLPVEAKCDAIEERVKSIQSDFYFAVPINEQLENMSTSMKDTLAAKFGTKTIGDVLQKLSMTSTFVMANMIGTIILLALMCYFIISIT